MEDENDLIAISLKQTEYYSAMFTKKEAAEALGCDPTEEAIIQALQQGDPFGTSVADRVVNGWDMAEDSSWEVI